MSLHLTDSPTSTVGFPYESCIAQPGLSSRGALSHHFAMNLKNVDKTRVLLVGTDRDTTAKINGGLSKHPDMYAKPTMAEFYEACLTEFRPHVLVVDLDWLDESGHNIARLIQSVSSPVLVFVTARASQALRAFEVGAVDCLMKPLQEDRFELCVKRIRERLARVRSLQEAPKAAELSQENAGRISVSVRNIMVTDRRRTHVINPYEIEWVGAAGDYTEIHVGGATHLLRQPLSVFLGRLPADAFCRIHRSFVVNLSKVSAMKALRNQDLLVKLKDKTVLRASRTFSLELRKAVSQHYRMRQSVGIEQ